MERMSGHSPTKHANSNPKPASALNPAKATGSDTTPSGGNTNSQSNPTATGDVNTGNTTAAASQKAQQCLVREQDQYMPIANVIRIMRRILPPHAKISDDAKETIQECVSEYIAFVTGEANERCQREQRKTVTAEDILWAIGKLGFDNYVEPLALFLHKYRESENSDRPALRGEFIKKERGMEFGPVGPHLMLPPPPPPYGPSFPFGGQHGHRMIDPSMAAVLFRDGSSSSGGGVGSSSSSGAQYQNLAGGFDPFSQFK